MMLHVNVKINLVSQRKQKIHQHTFHFFFVFFSKPKCLYLIYYRFIEQHFFAKEKIIFHLTVVFFPSVLSYVFLTPNFSFITQSTHYPYLHTLQRKLSLILFSFPFLFFLLYYVLLFPFTVLHSLAKKI